MSYENKVLQTFYHFSTEEHEKIEMWLIKHGYTWGTNTVCGSCCGMYADEYWVDGIGGKFKTEDKQAFADFARKEGIGCSVDGYTISADPSDEGEHQIII